MPEHTDADTGAVFCNDFCSFPMIHVGIENKITNTNAVPSLANANFQAPAHNIVSYRLMEVCFNGYLIIQI